MAQIFQGLFAPFAYWRHSR